jgi:hypothetical protein
MEFESAEALRQLYVHVICAAREKLTAELIMVHMLICRASASVWQDAWLPPEV